jgi:hypothetical protein
MADAASAVAGFAGINPWVGIGMMGAGALASGIQAIKRSSDAKKLEAEYDRLDKNLQPVSPEQYAYLNRVRQLERGMRMGTDPTSAMARRGLAQGLGQTQTNIARMGGGASTVSGLLRAQQGYNVGMGNVAAQAGQQADRMMMYQGGLIDNIQSRIYDLQMKRRNYAQLKAVAMREGAQDATSAAIGALAQGSTMIPKYNENIDTSKLNQGTKSNNLINPINPGKEVSGIGSPGTASYWMGQPSQYTAPSYGFSQYQMNMKSEPFIAPSAIQMPT